MELNEKHHLRFCKRQMFICIYTFQGGNKKKKHVKYICFSWNFTPSVSNFFHAKSCVVWKVLILGNHIQLPWGPHTWGFLCPQLVTAYQMSKSDN